MFFLGVPVERKRAPALPTCAETVKSSLKPYSYADAAEWVVNQAAKEHQIALQRAVATPTLPIIQKNQAAELIASDTSKSRFNRFREQLVSRRLMKKPKVGKVLPLFLNPPHINEHTLFGDASKRSEKLADIVFPRKTPAEVTRDYVTGHAMYRYTHSDYYPGERITRHYDTKHFDPNATFGIRTNTDIDGVGVRRCLDGSATRTDMCRLYNIGFKHFIAAHRPEDGCKLQKGFVNCLPDDRAFGCCTRDKDDCGVRALLEGEQDSSEEEKRRDAVSYVFRWRRKLREQNFRYHLLLKSCVAADVENTGFLPVCVLLKIAQEFDWIPSRLAVINVGRVFGILKEECEQNEPCIDFQAFKELFDMGCPMRPVNSLTKVPEVFYNKETEYRCLCRSVNLPRIPTRNAHDIADIMGEQEQAKALIWTTSPNKMGLSAEHFKEKRPKAELRKIYITLIPQEEKFNAVWEYAKQILSLTDDKMSINEMRLGWEKFKMLQK